MKSISFTAKSLKILVVCILVCTAGQSVFSDNHKPPAWFTETPSDPEYYYGVGTSRESMTDAEANARAALILGIAATVNTEVKNYLRARGTGADIEVENDFEEQSRSTATQEALPNLEILMRQPGQNHYALARLSKEKFDAHIKNQRAEVRGIIDHADERVAANDVVTALQRYTDALMLAKPLRFVSRETSGKPDETSLASEIEIKLTNLQTEIEIEMLSGNGQHGMYGEPLADVLVVQASYNGEPLAKFPLKAIYLWGTGRLRSSTERADASVRIYTDANGKGSCRVDAIRAISTQNHIRITADANVIQLPDSKRVDFHYVSTFPSEHKTGVPQITQNGEYGEPTFHERQEILLGIRVPNTCHVHLFSLLPDGNFDYKESVPIEQAYEGSGFRVQFTKSGWYFQLDKVPVTGERGIGLETLLVLTTSTEWKPNGKALTAKQLIEQLDTSVGKAHWRAGTVSSRVLPKEKTSILK